MTIVLTPPARLLLNCSSQSPRAPPRLLCRSYCSQSPLKPPFVGVWCHAVEWQSVPMSMLPPGHHRRNPMHDCTVQVMPSGSPVALITPARLLIPSMQAVVSIAYDRDRTGPLPWWVVLPAASIRASARLRCIIREVGSASVLPHDRFTQVDTIPYVVFAPLADSYFAVQVLPPSRLTSAASLSFSSSLPLVPETMVCKMHARLGRGSE